MKISVSNIAWKEEQDLEMYSFMKQNKISGLEIAPTRLIVQSPYQRNEEAKKIRKNLQDDYLLDIVSMQSIWRGKSEQLFGSAEEQLILKEYTKEAILFAEAIGSKNLVFGCPKNRVLPEGKKEEEAISFFKELGDYAYKHHTCIGLEANPKIYGTNFMNTTEQALEMVKKVNSMGCKLNYDFGTNLCNREKLSDLRENVEFINHVHISEPNLEIIKKRKEHLELFCILQEGNYQRYVSLEMKSTTNLEEVKCSLLYVKEIFG